MDNTKQKVIWAGCSRIDMRKGEKMFFRYLGLELSKYGKITKLSFVTTQALKRNVQEEIAIALIYR